MTRSGKKSGKSGDTMYPVEFRQRLPATWEDISDLPRSFGERIPTLERALDNYFERYFQSIIDEWGLLTSRDLQALEDRINRIHGEINSLQQERQNIETRFSRAEREVRALEEWSQ